MHALEERQIRGIVDRQAVRVGVDHDAGGAKVGERALGFLK
jgi:hypothetical protein